MYQLHRYIYEATSNHCPGITLESTIEGCQRSDSALFDNYRPKKVNVGSTHTCYIPSCEREVFAWEWDIKDHKTGGIVMIVVGSIFLFGCFCCLCSALIKNAYD